MELKDVSTVTVILRGQPYEVVRNVCLALCKTQKIRNVEITMNTEGCIDCIRKIAKEFGDKLSVGAGTVTTLEEAKEAIEAGAQFLLAPIVLDKEIIDYAKKHKVITVSGAFSPSEIWQALKNGTDIVKIFPATNVNKSYFRDVKAPLGNFKIMAVGGVNKNNARDFLEQGAEYLGMGGLIPRDVLDRNDLEEMIKASKLFEAEILTKM